MRVMVIVKATKTSEAGAMPSEADFAAMGKYNEELVKAGIMLDGDGLQPSSKGKRIKFSGSKRTVVDGPFTETKELVAGFWIWQVRSMEEAVEWARRCPTRCLVRTASWRSGRFTRRRISARSSRPSSARRKIASVRRSSARRRRPSDYRRPLQPGMRKAPTRRRVVRGAFLQIVTDVPDGAIV